MRGLVLASLLLAGPGCAADDERVVPASAVAPEATTVDATACAGLRDHVVNLRLSREALGVDPASLPADVLAQLRAGAAQSLGGNFVDQCQAQTTRSELACTMRASSLTAAAACRGAS
jgi:hypothetical protein